LVVEHHELPIVSLSLALPAGTRYDPAGREGMAEVTAELLTKGTTTRSADAIAATIEGVGGSLTAHTDPDVLILGTTVLREHLQIAFDLVSDVVLHATFPDAELELARTRTLSALRLERSRPDAVAERMFAAELYGRHPYGRHASEASVNAITAADVRGFAAARMRPRGALLVLAGDVTLDDARALALDALASWSGGPSPAAAPAAPPAATPTDILLVHRPGSQQSTMMVGNLVQRPGDSLYHASVLANRVVGGGVDSRLFLILREAKGWTYGAYTRLVRRHDRGYFLARAAVRTAVTDSALAELLVQLRRIRNEPVPPAELDGAKGFLIGSFPREIETPQQIAAQVTSVKLLGLGEAYLREYRERLAAVTEAGVTRAARHTIHPDSSVIVVVGDGREVYQGLRAIAPVRLVDVDGQPLTVEELGGDGQAGG
jgi:predicted Zn-dependent peptidase